MNRLHTTQRPSGPVPPTEFIDAALQKMVEVGIVAIVPGSSPNRYYRHREPTEAESAHLAEWENDWFNVHVAKN